VKTLPLYSFQAAAIARLRASHANLALTAPTGSGKGRILEEIALDPEERILVLTPLIALARQQRVRFLRAGVPPDRVRILSPEAALFRERDIRDWKPTLVAVDEAHCVHEWGARFRPAYGRLLYFLRELGCPRTLWMSATFPRALLTEISNQIPGEWTTLGEFRHPPLLQLRFVQSPANERIEVVREDFRSRTGPGLLFVGTRKEVGRYLGLFAEGRVVLPYHAGMSDEERRSVEALLMRESRGEAKTSVIATNAFGMGMDFPQFEWATLAQAPYSLLALMQACGRVGRGVRPGVATLYWAEEDFRFAGLLLGAENRSAQAELERLREYLEAAPEGRVEIERTLFL
jgi:ATP-dependent DNA helicase RecQ